MFKEENRKDLISRLDTLFLELKELSGIEEIGLHQIVDGRLKPIHKLDTEQLPAKKWIEIHSNNPQYVSQDPILQEVITTKRILAISDIEQYASNAMKIFSIKSLMTIPIVVDAVVVAIIAMPSMDKKIYFTDELIQNCQKAVMKYL